MTKTKQQQQQQQQQTQEKKKNPNSHSQKKLPNSSSLKRVDAPKEGLTPCEKQYMIGLHDAFDARASGSCVPDFHPFPTIRYEGEFEASLGTSSSGTDIFWIFPSVTNTVITAAATTNNSFVGGSGYTSGGGNIMVGFSSDAALAGDLDSLRVVSLSARFKNNQSFNNVNGRIIVTPFICPRVLCTQAQFTSSTTGDAVPGLMSGYITPNLNAPGSFEVSLDEMINKELLLSTMPVAPNGYAFRSQAGDTDQLGGLDLMAGWETFSNSTGLVSSGTQYEASNCEGLIGFICKIISSSDTASGVLLMTLKVNVEGSIAPGNGSGNTLRPSGLVVERNHAAGMGMEKLLLRAGTSFGSLVKPIILDVAKTAGKGLLAAML